MNKEQLIGLIENYAQTAKPSEIRVEVLPEGIKRDGFHWSVPIRTTSEHVKPYLLYNKLTKIERRLRDENQLDVLFEPEPLPLAPHPAETKMPARLEPERSKAAVVALVEQYAQEEEPADVIVNILGKQARRDGDFWHIPVHTDYALPNRFRYYEKLTDITLRLQDEQDINVLLVPS